MQAHSDVEVPFSPTSPDPEGALYRLLSIEDETTAHPRYSSLVKRLDSFARAAESQLS